MILPMWLKCSQSGSYPWDSRAPLPPAAGCGGVLCSGLFHHGQPLLPPPSLLEESHVKPDCYTPPSLLRAEGDICFGSRGCTVEMVWQHREESPEEAGSLCCSSLRCLCRGAVVECPDDPEAVNELLTPWMPKRQTRPTS